MLGVLNRFYKTQISDADYEIQEEQHNLNFNVVDIDNAIAQNLNTIKDLQNKIKALTLEKTELILKGNRKRVKLLKYKEMLDILYNTYEKELKGISDDCNLYWK
jgi:methionine synthase I (cobalamin-dependent)